MAQRLSALDTAFLHLEAPPAPMHLGALAIFEPTRPVHPRQVVALLEQRAAAVPQLARRVAPTLLLPGGQWVADPGFRARHHIKLHHLPAPGGADELATIASELMATPLDLDRPLWQLHVIAGRADGTFAILVKLHHALADGLRAVQLGAHLLDGDTLPATLAAAAEQEQPSPAATEWGWLGELVRGAGELLARPQDLPQRLAGQACRLLAGVPEAAVRLSDLLSIAADVVGHTRPTPETPLVAAVGSSGAPQRRLALLRLDLREIRTVRRRFGGTVNDILLTLVTGGLRGWLQGRGAPVDGLNMRALVPVSGRGGVSGNRLSGYLCDLPVHLSDPLQRLAAIRTTMDANKSAGPMRGPGALPVLAGQVPAALHRLTGPLTRRSANRLFDTVVTNVPMPSLAFTLGGAALREMYPIAPLAQGHALGIAASTYRGGLHLGLHADAEALADLGDLAGALSSTLAELARG